MKSNYKIFHLFGQFLLLVCILFGCAKSPNLDKKSNINTLSLAATSSKPNKPNIIVILIDDLGYQDCGFLNSAVSYSKNIDTMAAQGMVFDNAYAGAANCSPSRDCLLTGRYTPTTEVYTVQGTRGPETQMRLNGVSGIQHIQLGLTTIAQSLSGAGYITGLMGKWHLDGNKKTDPKSPEWLPGNYGFQYAFDDDGDIEDSDSGTDPTGKNSIRNTDPRGSASITDSAIAFMNRNKNSGKPFFAYVAYHAIHKPHTVPRDVLDSFKTIYSNQDQAAYAASVFVMDKYVGKITKYLKDSSLDKNTLLIFTSDNGAMWDSNQPSPFKGYKGNYYEGGIREPFIAWWPGTITPGKNSTPIINIDLHPTFIAAAGASTTTTLDGVNLLPVFKGNPATVNRDKLFWFFPTYLGLDSGAAPVRNNDTSFNARPQVVMRKGNYKVLLFLEEWMLNGGKDKIDSNNSVEIYNLATDKAESNNIVKTMPKQDRDGLVNDLVTWMNAIPASQMPTTK